MGNERSQSLSQQLQDLRDTYTKLDNRYEDLGDTIRKTDDVSVLPILEQRAGEVKRQIDQVRARLNCIDQIRPPSCET